MNVLLIPNRSKQDAQPLAQQAAAILQKQGAAVHFAAKQGEPEEFAWADTVLTVGGDGTILHVARASLPFGKPILGINLGRTGFLATCEVEEMPHKLALLVSGRYHLDERMVLRAQLQEDSTGWEQVALNDVVLCKASPLHTSDFHITCDGVPAGFYRADGVIVATPTGSTAYALSAGGPVVDTLAAGIVLVPICPHSLKAPPMVFSAGRRLAIQVLPPDREGVCVSCDGVAECTLYQESVVEIGVAPQRVQLVSFGQADQLFAIDRKLRGR